MNYTKFVREYCKNNSGTFYCKYNVDFDLHCDSHAIREQCSHVRHEVSQMGLFTLMDGLTSKFVENKNKNIG